MADQKEDAPSGPKGRRRASSSGNTSAAEQVATSKRLAEQHDRTAVLAEDMMDKVTVYLNNEMQASANEYDLLASMNNAAAERYASISQSSKEVAAQMQALNEKFKELQPHLDEIDALHANINKLDTAVDQLDEYSKKLEATFIQHYRSFPRAQGKH